MVKGTTGDVFKFYDGYYLLVQVAAGIYNLVSLANGNRRTSSWCWMGGSKNVTIPVRFWKEVDQPQPINCGPLVSFLVQVEVPVTFKVKTQVTL